MPETTISVTKMSHVHTFSKTDGYFHVTTSRVVLTKKADLASGIHWAYSLTDVQGVELDDTLGGKDLVLHVRTNRGLTKLKLRQGFFGGKDENMTALADLITQQKRDLLNAATPPPTAPVASLTAELERLSELRRRGVLSDEEFQQAKERLLRG